ncbi:MAG: hypothetical protein CVU98_00305 [Firmicutes bacterium HGW-Firmicutes-3]|jgi:hypothetical protein|nr:MAG: hypothetical protein CVU98_00305 [Firmicutes bacterium HGW-Firmicutes-3]
MKKHFSSKQQYKQIVGLLLISFLMLSTLFAIPVFADTTLPHPNLNTIKVYDLNAAPMPVDDLHPYGSALLTFKIDNLPGDTGDTTLVWYVNVEKKIGTNDWVIVSNLPTVDFMVNNIVSGTANMYQFEQLWIEDYEWDGSRTINYRVNVMLDDIVSNRGGNTAYSNVASLGLVSSPWALTELQQAQSLGLIPPILSGADLTKPITREEFCELALLLYEKTMDTTAQTVSPNPFTDTSNAQILKAFKLGITNGMSPTTFEPKTLINREQCAAMLFRTIQAMNPDGDYNIGHVKDFPDQKYISSWAVQGAKYMAGLGIIKGDPDGSFKPKAITPAQTATGYGLATREAAILMSVRTFTQP